MHRDYGWPLPNIEGDRAHGVMLKEVQSLALEGERTPQVTPQTDRPQKCSKDRMTIKGFCLITLFAGLSVTAVTGAQTAKDDIKGAGQDIKKAGKATGSAAKKTGTATKKTVKKGVNKTAEKTAEGANKVEQKTR